LPFSFDFIVFEILSDDTKQWNNPEKEE